MKSPFLQAAAELAQRYRAAFAHAWRHRRATDAVARLPHEAQFLPAALSLQETPAPAAPRLLMWALMAFAAIAVLWSVFGRIDIVATAQGKVVPSGRTKTIQSFATATVTAIHVSDGQRVKAGDLLVELDATVAHADQLRLRGDLAAARLQAARGQAVLAALDGRPAPVLARPDGVTDSQFAEARQLLASQWGEYSAKQMRIDAEIARREGEMMSTRALAGKLEQTVPIARQRAQDFKNLVDQNFVSKHGYLEREQVRIEQEAELENLRSRVKSIEAGLREGRAQKVELAAEMRRASMDSMADGQQKAGALEQEVQKADLQDKLTRLTAPVDGTVQQLAVHTVGGVVTPAQPVMVIVPQEDAVEVEAFIENKDVGFVKAGQEAEVKIEAFQYTKYGTVRAQVMSVSHDAIQDEKLGLVYALRVRMDKPSLQVDGADVALGPGMAASVEIKTGNRRVIEYFLSPLATHTSESLRER